MWSWNSDQQKLNFWLAVPNYAADATVYVGDTVLLGQCEQAHRIYIPFSIFIQRKSSVRETHKLENGYDTAIVHTTST